MSQAQPAPESTATKPMAKKNHNEGSKGVFPKACRRLLQAFAEQRPIRAGSLVVSLFGDAIAPRGGSVWLGSIIEALEPFGINDRLVRTSVFRLAKQGWLVSERIGRRSFYRLTDKGLRRFQEASRRIYAEPRQDWQGSWCLALLSGVDAAARDEMRRELGWQGFAPFSSNVLAHPAPNIGEVHDCLADLSGGDRVLLMDAQPQDRNGGFLTTLVSDAWQLDELGLRYRNFLAQFRPVYVATRGKRQLDPELAFCVRVLLIHEYRRILLRDPQLPQALLPERWDGTAAFQLCRNLYRRLAVPAEEFLGDHLENAYGPLPPAGADFFQRFGGIDAAPMRAN